MRIIPCSSRSAMHNRVRGPRESTRRSNSGVTIVNTATSPATAPRTISQGLRRVKQLKGLLREHETRASESVSYAAGKQPKFGFKAEREARTKAQSELIRIESAIAVANAKTRIDADGRTQMPLAEAIRRLQEIKGDITFLSGLTLRDGTEEEASHEWDDGAGRNVRRTKQVTYVSELSVVNRVAEVQALRERFEALNDAVEAANHRTQIEIEAA